MPLAVWPATLPQVAQEELYQRKNANTLNGRKTDGGRTIVRRRTVRVSRSERYSFKMTGDQFEDFETFYYETIDEGAARFTFPIVNPDGTTTAREVLIDPETTPDVNSEGGIWWIVTMDLLVFPDA